MSYKSKISNLELKVTDIKTPKYEIIDFHTHFGFLYGVLSGIEDYFSSYNALEIVDKMKSFGVTKVVNLDGGFGEESKKMMTKIEGAEDFFITFGSADVAKFEQPDFDSMIYKTLKQHKENGFKGLKFWKTIGLKIKDKAGRYLRPDDDRLKCIWEYAAEFSLPVLFHIGDLKGFFRPIDSENEYYEILKDFPDWSFHGEQFYRYEQLLDMQANLIQNNPKTKFIIPHVGGCGENLEQVSRWLKAFPNMYIDIADRLSELGRQPYTAKKFFEDNQDKILFGTDVIPTDIERYEIYYRFFETNDEYFEYRTPNGLLLGDWRIHAVNLEDEVLEKIYNKNAKKLLNLD